VGHSYFMVPQLDRARLAAVWQHQIRPLLAEWETLSGGRWTEREMAAFLQPSAGRAARRKPAGV